MSSYQSAAQKRALLPLLLFVLVFMGTGIYYHLQGVDYAFYQLPAPVAIIPAIVLAFFLSGQTLERTVEQFSAGAGHSNIIAMCLIYLLAGAFSSVAEATGGVDATVAMGMSFVPESAVLPGLFVLTAFIATAMGTSMGTLAAMAPIGLSISDTLGLDRTLVAGVLISGAMFGDNLSIISDTSIAATRTQGASVRDKFLVNAKVALPAALLLVILLLLQPVETAQLPTSEASPWLVLPYLAVIALAVSGVNVFLVLLIGILLSLVIGASVGTYQVNQLGSDMYKGFTQMQEIFILSLLVGGLSELMRQQGGLVWVVQSINRFSSKLKRYPYLGRKISIAMLAAVTNSCVANNTVAIVICGDAARDIARDGGIDAKESASLLDIFACIVQGLLPYGAQMLLIGAAFSLSPLELAGQVWYCYLLALSAVVSMFFKRHGHQAKAS